MHGVYAIMVWNILKRRCDRRPKVKTAPIIQDPEAVQNHVNVTFLSEICCLFSSLCENQDLRFNAANIVYVECAEICLGFLLQICLAGQLACQDFGTNCCQGGISPGCSKLNAHYLRVHRFFLSEIHFGQVLWDEQKSLQNIAWQTGSTFITATLRSSG